MADGSQRPPRDYLRPHDRWSCGDNSWGTPCPTGPSRSGVCQAGSACEPRKLGDRWFCNRSAVRGGPCELGPGPQGECRVVHATCQPRYSLRHRRGHWTIVAVTGAIGLFSIWLSGPARNRWLSAGKLTAVHAQILDSQGERRCQACHEAGDQGVAVWLATAVGQRPVADGGSQADRCLECHDERLAMETALLPHNVPLPTLQQWTKEACQRSELKPPRIASETKLVCADCHREHHGRRHELAAMTDRQCQTCHAKSFTSFADGHPEFDADSVWSRPNMRFGHAVHRQRHFPAASREFACKSCHAVDWAGEPASPSYMTCAGCHEQEIERSLGAGVAVIRLPIVDIDALRDAGHDVGLWPAAATGDFDGCLTLPLALMLQLDPPASEAIRQLGCNFDLFDLDLRDQAQVRHVATIAKGIRHAMQELATQGPAVIQRELHERIGDPGMTVAASHLFEGAAPEFWKELAARWFPDEDRGPVAGDLGDAPQTTPAGPAGPGPSVPVTRWFADDELLQVRYVPLGHADPVLHSWLTLGAITADRHSAQLSGDWYSQTAPGLCIACHQVHSGTIGWRSARVFPPLTRYSHAPHLVLPALADCAACHPWRTSGFAEAAADFEPVTKALCVSCHSSQLAGDHCLLCHRYHASSPVADGEFRP